MTDKKGTCSPEIAARFKNYTENSSPIAGESFVADWNEDDAALGATSDKQERAVSKPKHSSRKPELEGDNHWDPSF